MQMVAFKLWAWGKPPGTLVTFKAMRNPPVSLQHLSIGEDGATEVALVLIRLSVSNNGHGPVQGWSTQNLDWILIFILQSPWTALRTTDGLCGWAPGSLQRTVCGFVVGSWCHSSVSNNFVFFSAKYQPKNFLTNNRNLKFCDNIVDSLFMQHPSLHNFHHNLV